MEIFETDIVKKEFEKVQKEDLICLNVDIVKKGFLNHFIKTFWPAVNSVGRIFAGVVNLLI